MTDLRDFDTLDELQVFVDGLEQEVERLRTALIVISTSKYSSEDELKEYAAQALKED